MMRRKVVSAVSKNQFEEEVYSTNKSFGLILIALDKFCYWVKILITFFLST